MHGTYKSNTISPTGKYEIIYGENRELRMGGPYASSIHIQIAKTAPFFVADNCYNFAYCLNNEKGFYFLSFTTDLKIRMNYFEIDTKELTSFEKLFDYLEIVSFNQEYFALNYKNWNNVENKYDEERVDFIFALEKIICKNIINPIIRILPNYGIDIVTFYDTRKIVNERLKGATCYPDNKIDFFTEYGFHIHYNDNNIVNFIEIMGDMQASFELYSKNPFKTPINEMVEILYEKNGHEVNLIDAPQNYMYLNLSLGVFRNSTPEKFANYIEQNKADDPQSFKNGTPEWMLVDLEKTKHFHTIGIGEKDYFRNPIYFNK